MTSFRILTLVVGQLDTNCYLYIDNKTSKTLIIDPGDDGDYIINTILINHLQPIAIVATHGHFDHLLAVLEIKLAFQIPFLMHREDLFLLKRVRQSALYFLGIKADPAAKIDKFIKANSRIDIGESSFKVFHLPGHTPGSICLYNKETETAFPGDVIFKDGVGRTDHNYSSKTDLHKSISRLTKLTGTTTIYPGHGEAFKLVNISKFA